MRIVHINEIAAIHKEVRDRFKLGYKSTNKYYSLDFGTRSFAKKVLRNKNGPGSAMDFLDPLYDRIDLNADFVDTQKFILDNLLEAPIEKRSGNCREMVALVLNNAAYRRIPCG